MAYAPYTPEELAELRKTASKTQLWPVAHKLLATLASVESERQFQQARADGFEELLVQAMAERDAARAALEELRETALALLDALPFDANSCVGRRHEHMVVATKSCRFAPPYAGSWYACDECAADPPADLPTAEATDRRIAAPLRTLRALLEGGSE